ncbi:UNVERIFIED_CONTAM: hypothetical protein Sradi_6957800, partial [Sesamum radiatum]
MGAQVCRPKVEGGLGIRSVLYMNQALMLKHVWRILQADTSSIWVAWVLRHRLHNKTIWTYHSSSSSWCWNKLIKLSLVLRAGLDYRVGDGRTFTYGLTFGILKVLSFVGSPRPLYHGPPFGCLVEFGHSAGFL